MPKKVQRKTGMKKTYTGSGKAQKRGERRAQLRRERSPRAERRLAQIAEEQRQLDFSEQPADPGPPAVRWSSGTWTKVEPAPPPPPPPPPPPTPVKPRMTMAEAAWAVIAHHYSMKRGAELAGCTRQQLRLYIDVYVDRSR